ncbi:MAG: hypothetical protein HUJ75_02730, partial [Parasporobacterium sp.]|nr:hypothetical protein [Parasporobacterium sp.]
MSLKIIIGPASSGKSMKLARDLVKEAHEHPEKSFIALVPEQFTLQMQKRLTMLHEKHALFNVDIVSFNRLARKVFNELGEQTGQVLDDLGKTLILKRVLEECQDDMIIYKKKAHLSGFVDEIKSMITEFRQYEIGPEELKIMAEDAAGNDMLQGKLQDLILILNRFNETIAEKFLTSEDVLEKFVDLVQKSDIIKGSEIYLDGFTGFTPVQYRLIKEFLKAEADVTVALTLPADRINENCPDHDLFALSNKTVKRLKKAAFEAGKDVLEYTDIANVSDEEKAGPGNADTVTEHEAEKESLQGSSQSSGPVMYKCPCNNIKEEVNWVASEILRLVKDEDYRFREIGIVTCGLETYYEPLKETLKEAGIACFIDYKTGLLDNPLVRFIMGALEIIEDNYSFNSVFNFLKSGLGPIKRD